MNARNTTPRTSSLVHNAMTLLGAATLMASPAMAQSFVLIETPVAMEQVSDMNEDTRDGGWVNPWVQIADYDHNGKVDAMDLYAFFVDWDAGKSSADINGDQWIDVADVWFYLEIWNSVIAPPSPPSSGEKSKGK